MGNGCLVLQRFNRLRLGSALHNRRLRFTFDHLDSVDDYIVLDTLMLFPHDSLGWLFVSFETIE